MKPIYSNNRLLADSIMIYGCSAAQRVYNELSVEQRFLPLAFMVHASPYGLEMEDLIKKTFSEEELVRAVDLMQEMYKPVPTKGFFAKLNYRVKKFLLNC
ncbi:MAG: hypothetical protein WCV58_00960 [Patescibacteria group bacterium]